MKTILQEQYALTQRSREALLGFAEDSMGNSINTPVQAYNGSNISYLLEHIASCYIHWLHHFAMGQPDRMLGEEGINTLPQFRELYKEVDAITVAFLDTFGDLPHKPISGISHAWGANTATPLQLFTHVMTHEYHHKGQILAMCRLLGYTPPMTDMSLIFL